MIEKENWQALNEIKDARLTPKLLSRRIRSLKDGYLSVGVENYLLSQKGAPVRMFLRLTGAQTDKETGIEKLKIVADRRALLQAVRQDSAWPLPLCATRTDLRPRQLMAELAHEFPGNGLFKDEVKKLSCSVDC